KLEHLNQALTIFVRGKLPQLIQELCKGATIWKYRLAGEQTVRTPAPIRDIRNCRVNLSCFHLHDVYGPSFSILHDQVLPILDFRESEHAKSQLFFPQRPASPGFPHFDRAAVNVPHQEQGRIRCERDNTYRWILVRANSLAAHNVPYIQPALIPWPNV